jgi:hypothetical protein
MKRAVNIKQILAEVVILLCIFSYVGAEPPGGPLKVLDNGLIEGVVFNSLYNNDPFPNVRVRTYDSLGIQVAENITDSLGTFSLSLSSGVYSEHFTRIGYRSRYVLNINIAENETTHISTILFPMGCRYILGDINTSTRVNGVDVVFAVAFLKGGPVPPLGCYCFSGTTPYPQADVNGSCTFDGLDVTYMVRYFKGGPALQFCPDCPPE